MPIQKIYVFNVEKHSDMNKWLNRDSSNPEGRTDLPILAFLIQHSDGNILYDTGSSRLVRTQQSEYYYVKALGEDISMCFDGTSDIVQYLDEVGIDSLSHLVVSHGHFDHAGYIDELMQKKYPGVNVVLHEAEAKAIRNPGKQEKVYFRDELKCLDKVTTIYEEVTLMWDSSIETLHLPGHTPGQFGLILPNLKLVFSGDGVFVPENLEGHLPDEQMVMDEGQYMQSVNTLRSKQQEGYKIIMSHAPMFFSDKKRFMAQFGGKGEIVKEGNLDYLVITYS